MATEPRDRVFEELDVETSRYNEETGTETFVLNLGPHHPSTHGVLRLELEIDGEYVVRCEPHIGYLHTGIEKTCEFRTYHQIVPFIDRMDYLNPWSEEFGYILAAEALYGVEIPQRAQYVRVILAELSRIASHLVWLGTSALELNVSSMFMFCFRDRENILDVFEMVSGDRFFPRYFRIGGLMQDVSDDFPDHIREFFAKFRKHLKEYHGILTKNLFWKMRFENVAQVTLDQCIDYGLSGPIIRACGEPYDVRKAFPYSAYEDFDFEVPTRTKGDAYARYLVRMDEIEQSMRIVEQALDNLPDGPIVTQDERFNTGLSQHQEGFYKMKKPHPHKGLFPPKGESYVSIEGARGEKGYWVVSDGTNKPIRVRMRSPSFGNVQALPLMIEGSYLSDAIVAIASTDPVLGDVDR